MSETEKINIQVVYALPDKQRVIDLNVEIGCTAKTAIEQSNITQQFLNIDIEAIKLGIFGKTIKIDQILAAGDRIEIYRPLIVDPKDSRRKRAEKTKVIKEQKNISDE